MNEFRNNYILNVSKFDDNLYVGTNGNGLIIYSLKNNALNLLYEGIHSYQFNLDNAVQMIALNNYIFYYDIFMIVI